MSRLTTIDRLGEQVKAEIAQLRARGHTVEEIRQALETHGIAYSTLARHVASNVDEVVAAIRESRGIAEAVIEQLGDSEGAAKTRGLNLELSHRLLTRTLLAERSGKLELGPREIRDLSTALRSLTASAKDSTETVRRKQQAAVAAERRDQKERLQKAGASGRIALDAMAEAIEIMGLG